jgi:hypothetical protein
MVEKFEKKFLGTWWVIVNKLIKLVYPNGKAEVYIAFKSL